jgi:hypothetical protein
VIYKRGSTYWVQLKRKGRLIRRSTGTGVLRDAQKIEAKLRSDLVLGIFGILERPLAPRCGILPRTSSSLRRRRGSRTNRKHSVITSGP